MSQFQPPRGPGLKPHRGTAILVLGILSLVIGCVGWILGIIAMYMAANDLREMDAGVMDPTGRGNTQAGRVCGIIGVVLQLGGLIFMVLWFTVIAGAVAAGAAGR